MEPGLALDDNSPESHRRARVRAVLERRKLTDNGTTDQATAAWEQARFVARARTLFWARLIFLTFGLLILAVPRWSSYFGFHGLLGFAGYLTMLFYSVANYLVIEHPTAGRWVTYITLCLDVLVLVVLLVKPQLGGGLQNPLLGTQLVFTALFTLLFPKRMGFLPPLLGLLITIRLDLLLNKNNFTAIDVLTVVWYFGLNIILSYVLMYLNDREVADHREHVQLQADLQELAVVDERSRLAREIHDGLGASLSSMIIQSEFILGLAQEPALREEIQELKTTAEESIEELRRSLSMMREDFELTRGLDEYVKSFHARTQLDVRFERNGLPRKLAPDAQLALFRILQECLTNAVKHASPTHVQVRLDYEPERVQLLVRDDGKGFDPKHTPRGHYGLLNMRERAMKLGATLLVDSAPGAGTRVSFSLPASRP